MENKKEPAIDDAATEALLEFVLDVDWLGTKEFCDKFGYPVPNWQGSVQVAVMDMLTVDAARWKVVRDKAKELKKEQHTAALSVNKQPEKEVDTVEQAAEKQANKWCSNNSYEAGKQCFIAGANRIMTTHVPIEEVFSIIDEHIAFHNKLKSSASTRGIMHQLEIVKNRIRSLIKPQ